MPDHLFLIPFPAGLLPALLLPLVGNLLRLRDEWLAALVALRGRGARRAARRPGRRAIGCVAGSPSG